MVEAGKLSTVHSRVTDFSRDVTVVGWRPANDGRAGNKTIINLWFRHNSDPAWWRNGDILTSRSFLGVEISPNDGS